jgi:hypothetical protein
MTAYAHQTKQLRTSHIVASPQSTAMLWDHLEPFPQDPNAPSPRSFDVGESRVARQDPALSTQCTDALDRALAQLTLIGPAAGAELRRVVLGLG